MSSNEIEIMGVSKATTSRNAVSTAQNRCISPSASSSSSSSTFDSVSTCALQDESNAKIRVGSDYQVNLEPYNLKHFENDDRKTLAEKADIVWRPSKKITDKQLDNYLDEIINEKSYSLEHAIRLLSAYDHDIRKALVMANKFKPNIEEWSKEEKVMFEHAFWFHGKNFNKIKLMLPHKSQASLVKHYYVWKKTRMHKSLMDYQMDLKQANITDQNNVNGMGRASNGVAGDFLNENGIVYEELDLTEKSDDNDSVDENSGSNLTKICCNCDFITNDLQSTLKGMLCNPCYAFWKSTGGLMRPDYQINKPIPSGNQAGGVSASASGSSQNHGYLQSSAYRTNRYLTITNNTNGNGGLGTSGGNSIMNNASSGTSDNSGQVSLSKDAKNFHKSLRKPPKGIYLNYEELIELLQCNNRKIFNQLTRRVDALKKQTQVNKQEIDELIKKATENQNETFQTEINDMLASIEDNLSVQHTVGWTQKEILYALRAFSKYGNNFEVISLIIPTKPESSIRAFYYYYKDIYNLDKIIPNSDELEKIADEIHEKINKDTSERALPAEIKI